MPHFRLSAVTQAPPSHPPPYHHQLRSRRVSFCRPAQHSLPAQLLQCASREVQISSIVHEIADPATDHVDCDDEKYNRTAATAGNDASCMETIYVVESTTQQPIVPDESRDGSIATDTTLLQQVASTALLISPFFFWGTSMVAMKEVLPHATPLLISTLRLVPAGVVLVGWAAANGRKQPQTLTAWAWITAFALVDAAAFQGFLAEGLQRTPAGLGSVIIDSQPLSVAVLAAILFGEKLQPAGFVGLFLGVLGLLMLELPPQDLGPLMQLLNSAGVQQAASGVSNVVADLTMTSADGFVEGDQSGSIWDSGEWWMLLAAQAMAVGTVMVRGVAKHCDPFIATGWHMIIGGLMLLGFIAATDSSSIASSLAQFGVDDYLAMAYVSLLGGAASYGVFFDNATRGNLTALSSLTFLTPMFAAAGGFLLLNETLTPLQLTGAAVTLSAVYLINK